LSPRLKKNNKLLHTSIIPLEIAEETSICDLCKKKSLSILPPTCMGCWEAFIGDFGDFIVYNFEYIKHKVTANLGNDEVSELSKQRIQRVAKDLDSLRKKFWKFDKTKPKERIFEELFSETLNLFEIFKERCEEKEFFILEKLLDVAFQKEAEQQEEVKEENKETRIEKIRKRQKNIVPETMRERAAKEFQKFCSANKNFDPVRILSDNIEEFKEVDRKLGVKKKIGSKNQMGGDKNHIFARKKNSVSKDAVLQDIKNFKKSDAKRNNEFMDGPPPSKKFKPN